VPLFHRVPGDDMLWVASMSVLDSPITTTELIELARLYDAPFSLPIPPSVAEEAALPGGRAAWERGLEGGRRHVLDVLWLPSARLCKARSDVQQVLDMMTLRAATRRAQEEASELRLLFHESPWTGARLELLARAEVAACFAGHLGAIAERAELEVA